MSTPDDRLRELGLELPRIPASPPGHAPRPIEPLVVHDSLVFFSGIAPFDVTGFGDQPAVVNGFSDRVIEVYGTERGRCARSAIGCADLPRNIPVEVEAIVALRRD